MRPTLSIVIAVLSIILFSSCKPPVKSEDRDEAEVATQDVAPAPPAPTNGQLGIENAEPLYLENPVSIEELEEVGSLDISKITVSDDSPYAKYRDENGQISIGRYSDADLEEGLGLLGVTKSLGELKGPKVAVPDVKIKSIGLLTSEPSEKFFHT